MSSRDLFTDLPGTKSGGERLNGVKKPIEKQNRALRDAFETTMTNGKGNERRCPVNKGKQEERSWPPLRRSKRVEK